MSIITYSNDIWLASQSLLTVALSSSTLANILLLCTAKNSKYSHANSQLLFNQEDAGAGEITQWIRALAVLTKYAANFMST